MATEFNGTFFLELFNPYRNKYTRNYRIPSKGSLSKSCESPWITINKYLPKKLIEEAIRGDIIIGYFSNTMPDYFGIDIDDHNNNPSSEYKVTLRLQLLYEKVLHNLKVVPSIVVQSPNGFHLYWFLDERLPSMVISKLATEILLGVQIEARPTPNLSLRIPNRNSFLDPHSLTPIRFDPDIKRYHPALLFEDKYLAELQFSKNDRKGYKKNSNVSHQKIEAKESEFIPIQNGDSNRVLNALIPFYKRCGLGLYDAMSRIQMLLEQSPNYSGELKRKPERLRQRGKSYYRDNTR